MLVYQRVLEYTWNTGIVLYDFINDWTLMVGIFRIRMHFSLAYWYYQKLSSRFLPVVTLWVCVSIIIHCSYVALLCTRIHYYPLWLSTYPLLSTIIIHYYPLLSTMISTCSLSIFPPMARFGPDVTERFLQETGYALVVRSHQACFSVVSGSMFSYYQILLYVIIYI